MPHVQPPPAAENTYRGCFSQLNQVYRAVAEMESVLLFDFFRLFETLDPSVYLWDDVHIFPPFSTLETNMMVATNLCIRAPSSDK